MSKKKCILLKLTGELFSQKNRPQLSTVIEQLASLRSTHQFHLVVGGGNIFRGSHDAKQMQIQESTGHQIGMLATLINGLFLYDVLTHAGQDVTLLTAITCPSVGKTVSIQAIHSALNAGKTLIFAGGTGSPYVTNDTNAVIRALQVNADAVWKGSSIDGVYSDDPAKNPQAARLNKLTYNYALKNQLNVMDQAAFLLAQRHRLPTRVFSLFAQDALVNAAHDKTYGSTILTDQE